MEYGGIGIVDVETKLKALKASWVSRIINTDSNIHKILNSFCMFLMLILTIYCKQVKLN